MLATPPVLALDFPSRRIRPSPLGNIRGLPPRTAARAPGSRRRGASRRLRYHAPAPPADRSAPRDRFGTAPPGERQTLGEPLAGALPQRWGERATVRSRPGRATSISGGMLDCVSHRTPPLPTGSPCVCGVPAASSGGSSSMGGLREARHDGPRCRAIVPAPAGVRARRRPGPFTARGRKGKRRSGISASMGGPPGHPARPARRRSGRPSRRTTPPRRAAPG